MRNKFDEQLLQLNHEMIEMGALCEEVIALSSQALTEGDTALAAKVAPLDSEIDHKEREIENLCLKLLLRQQPVARDLRADLRRTEDDHRYGAHRRSGGGHRGDRGLFRRAAGGKRRPFEGNGEGGHTNGDGKCGRLCEM